MGDGPKEPVTSDGPWTGIGPPDRVVDVDPKKYARLVHHFHNAHLDCTGSCRHGDCPKCGPSRDGGCPLPPALPHWTECPPDAETMSDRRRASAGDPFLFDCGGCDECGVGWRKHHECHVNGFRKWCEWTDEDHEKLGVLGRTSIVLWADYDLLERVRNRMLDNELNPE